MHFTPVDRCILLCEILGSSFYMLRFGWWLVETEDGYHLDCGQLAIVQYIYYIVFMNSNVDDI